MDIVEEIEIPVRAIKPDPNQPRKVFDKEAIEEMGQSMLGGDGVINSIEIDQNNVIVTGERRWGG